MKNYWFYLEPYTFIFHSDSTGRRVIYNTLNSAYLLVPESDFIANLFEQLDNAGNGYCVTITEEEITGNTPFKNFARLIAKTFSGGLVEVLEGETKPFLFKPMLFLNTEIRKAKEENISFLGERILENLNEVTLYLPGTRCDLKENIYCKQLLYPISWQDKVSMSISDYLTLLLDLETSGIDKVNILGGDLSHNGLLPELLPTLTQSKFKKVFYVSLEELNESCFRWFKDEQTKLVVWISPPGNKEKLDTLKHHFASENIIWKWIVSSEKDIFTIDKLAIPKSVNMEMIPLYTGKNLPFFEKFIFNSIDDILEEPISQKLYSEDKL